MSAPMPEGRNRSTSPCPESRSINGFRFTCWYRYEDGHGWNEEPHRHWFSMIDDDGHKVDVAWSTPDGPGSTAQPEGDAS